MENELGGRREIVIWILGTRVRRGSRERTRVPRGSRENGVSEERQCVFQETNADSSNFK